MTGDLLPSAADKPHWEGAPTFSAAWDACMGRANRAADTPEYAAFAAQHLWRLLDARVLAIAPEQAAALPLLYPSRDTGVGADGQQNMADLNAVMARLALPWPLIYLDLGGVQAKEWSLGAPPINGALIGRGGLAPVLGADDLWISIFHSATADDGRVVSWAGGAIVQGDSIPDQWTPPEIMDIPIEHYLGDRAAALREDSIDFWKLGLCAVAERAVAVLQWLESANVEIIDAPVSRQVRRASERQGREIAKIVSVKLPRSRRANQKGSANAGAIDYDHRFEVSGHYKFYRPETRIGGKDPEKLSWVPERNGYFRRIWCPPFVKGPADKPLMFKTRRLKGPSDGWSDETVERLPR